MRNANQRGIVIGPIVWVVAILAVLASAIAAGSGAFNGDTSAIKAKAQATAILEYADSVKTGVGRLLAKGCNDTGISFENPVVSGYTNPNAPADKSCHVFDINGGGVVFKKRHPDWIDTTPDATNEITFSGGNTVIGFGGPLDKAYSAELIFRFHGVRDDICKQVNQLVGIDGIPDNGLLYSPGSFIGGYSASGQIRAAKLNGHMVGCFHSSTAGNYNVLYQILIVR
jgi:type II secretory pathway pseudopilin PulG